jgi:O-antigen/teichoic acid export membrane protein
MAAAEGLGRSVARSAAWSVLLRLMIRGLGLISTLILARLLLPQDFGLVAMATLVIGVLEFIFDFSFSQYLIREREAERSLYDTVWTLSVIRSTLIAGLMAVGAPLIAAFYAEPRLTPIFWFLAFTSLLAGFENVGTVDFQKKLQFHREFRYRGAIKIISFAATIALAFSLRSYWALVWGTVVGQVTLVVLSYAMCDYRPRFDLSQTRRVFSFSLWYMLASIFGAFLTRSPALVLGRLDGPASVGFFEVGREVADLPTTELVWPIARVLYPGYASAANDLPVMRKLFLDSTAITMCLATPLALGVSATAELMVRIALGTQWLPAVPVIQVMAISGLVRLSYSGLQSIVTALGKPSLYAYLAMFSCCVTMPPTLFGVVNYGLTGAAVGYLCGIMLSAIVFQVCGLRLARVGPVVFWRSWIRSIAAGIVMYWAVAGTMKFLMPLANGFMGYLGVALLLVVLGAFVYVSASVMLWKLAGSPAGGEQIMLDEIRKRLSRRLRSTPD